ncbi:cytochrome c biogenesis protein ResB [Bacillus sp. 2205SS5-2]|uniref:cytochrome c biogenesis protein ResB n=1 Tax=Bacillus sp. 2205SS5-2 TaxID=3109031 RepID=UPI0030055E47
MKDTICECAHVNPPGTVLCQSCGRALTDAAKNEKIHDMRYEGSSRRSQTYNKTFVDKIWNFFSSVKVGVWIIILTLIASAVGTIFPQELYIPSRTPEQFYQEEYGWLGLAYYRLGLHNLYSSWWYILLVASLAISLVVASVDRLFPLYKSLKNQRVIRHDSFLKRQRMYSVSEDVSVAEVEVIKQKMKEKRYRLFEEKGSFLGERGRFSRWGPYVNHLGLIVFLFGGMLRLVPGMYIDETLWIREGETLPIPGTEKQYYLENKKFILETYSKEEDKDVFDEAIDRVGTIPKNFQTDVVLFEQPESLLPGQQAELKEVKSGEIRVNEPLKFNGFALYQTSYKLNEFKTMSFSLSKKDTEENMGTITIDLFSPEDEYLLENGNKIELMGYFPDFSGLNDEGEPETASSLPNNPAFLFKMFTPEHPEGEVSFVGIMQNVDSGNDYKMSFAGIETRNISVLNVNKDNTLWILGLGGFIFMVGVIQGAYWNHRRIWLKYQDGKLTIAGHTNKNWQTVKKDLQYILNGSDINMPIDQSEDEK